MTKLTVVSCLLKWKVIFMLPEHESTERSHYKEAPWQPAKKYVPENAHIYSDCASVEKHYSDQYSQGLHLEHIHTRWYCLEMYRS